MLRNNNFANNLNITIADTKIEVNKFYSRCVYSDINNKKQNPILKLLFAIVNIKLETMPTRNIAVPIISYYRKRRFILLNN